MGDGWRGRTATETALRRNPPSPGNATLRATAGLWSESSGAAVTCENCGHHNADESTFCASCGHRLGTPCPACGTVDLPNARFCRSCGTMRADSSPAPGPEGERRIVTSLFADLAGSTAVAGRLDPEDWAEIAHEALSVMSESIDRYGGTVARLMGDGLLAFFGAPTSHEDDAERAVRAALDVLTDVSSLRGRLVSRLLSGGAMLAEGELEVRVGITTGSVVAAAVGGDVKNEYTALGDSVNLAARLQQAAEAGTVLISDDTLGHVAHAVSTVPVEGLALKGIDGPVVAHRVVGMRVDRGSTRGLGMEVPSVGRAAERARLMEALDAVEAGRSSIVVVVGEAGLGKSRLLSDVARDVAADRHIRWCAAGCLSFESAMPYALAKRLLTATGGAGDPALAERLDRLPADRRMLYSEILSSLEEDLGSAGEISREALAMAFGEVFGGLTGDTPDPTPVVIAIDDLHWADAASTELLVALFSHTDRFPLLFLLATRPERTGPVRAVIEAAANDFPDRYVQVPIGPLRPEESGLLIDALLTASRVPPDLVESISRRSEGNPYYLEELVRELIQTGIVVRTSAGWEATGASLDWSVPESLQTLLQVRFDRLDEATRATLQIASVVGREFEADIVARARGTDIGGHLRELLKVGLVEESDPRTRTFAFRHALAQEAAYRSILQRKRRVLHRLVGEAIEADAEHSDAAPLLAHHFLAAGDAQRGCRASLAAGDRAAALSALTDAHGHYDRGIAALDDSVDAGTATRLWLGRGRVKDLLGDRDGGRSDLERALDMARRSADRAAEWETLVALGELWAAERYDRTGEYFRAALELARVAGTREMVGISLNRLGNWYINAEDPPEGIRLHEEALEIFRSIGSDSGQAASHDLLGTANLVGGSSPTALEHYELAIRGFRASGDRRGMASALVSAAILAPSYEAQVEPPELTTAAGLQRCDEALELVTSIGWSAGEAYARLIRAQLLGFAGDLGAGMREAETALDIAHRIGHRQWVVGGLLAIGALETDILDLSGAISHLSESLSAAHEVGSVNWVLQVSAALGMALIEDGKPEEAARVVGDALDRPAAQRFRPHRLCRLVGAHAAVRVGEPEEALARLDDLAGVTPRHSSGEISPAVALVRGEALAWVDEAAAAQVLRTGLASSERWGSLPMRWRLSLALARLGGEGADDHVRAAYDLMEVLAGTLDDARAESMRRRGRQLVESTLASDAAHRPSMGTGISWTRRGAPS